MEETVFQQRTDLTKLNEAVNAIRDTIGKVIVGQHKMVDLLIAGLLSDGHILIEGVPALQKH
jgi:MoxR-like ATPase